MLSIIDTSRPGWRVNFPVALLPDMCLMKVYTLLDPYDTVPWRFGATSPTMCFDGCNVVFYSARYGRGTC